MIHPRRFCQKIKVVVRYRILKSIRSAPALYSRWIPNNRLSHKYKTEQFLLLHKWLIFNDELPDPDLRTEKDGYACRNSAEYSTVCTLSRYPLANRHNFLYHLSKIWPVLTNRIERAERERIEHSSSSTPSPSSIHAGRHREQKPPSRGVPSGGVSAAPQVQRMPRTGVRPLIIQMRRVACG